MTDASTRRGMAGSGLLLAILLGAAFDSYGMEAAVRTGLKMEARPKADLQAAAEDAPVARDPRRGLPAHGWRLSDNVHLPAEMDSIGQLALDGNSGTRWSTGRPMRPGDEVTLDMGASQRIGRIVLDNTSSPANYPRGYVTEASTDGKVWRELARDSPATVANQQIHGRLNIVFSPTAARYLRIINQGGENRMDWSIDELFVYGAPRYSNEVPVGEGGWGRMVRLEGGHWLAVVTRYPSTTTHFLQIKISTDNARTWTVLSQIVEPGRKLDNGDVIQLPDGAILLTARSVIDGTSYQLPVYRSRDVGRSWKRLSMIDANDKVINHNHPSQGLWEPHFFLMETGNLGVAYANEKHSIKSPSYSQVCAERVSHDGGETWGPEIILVSETGGGALRPGMPVVARMKNGAYIEVSEVVGIDNAAVYYKISRDGLIWPGGFGTRIPLQHAGPWVTSLSDGRLAVTSCSNEISYSDDFGMSWSHDTAPPWDIGFAFSWPAVYEIAPRQMAFMNTFHGVHIRFQKVDR